MEESLLRSKFSPSKFEDLEEFLDEDDELEED